MLSTVRDPADPVAASGGRRLICDAGAGNVLTTIVENEREAPGKARRLLVMGPDFGSTQALPDSGELTVGRADTAEVRLDDPLASRFHARLIISPGPKVEIEDLNSANK